MIDSSDVKLTHGLIIAIANAIKKHGAISPCGKERRMRDGVRDFDNYGKWLFYNFKLNPEDLIGSTGMIRIFDDKEETK